MMIKGVPYIRQRHDYTCGPASLKMVLNFLGVGTHREVLLKMARSEVAIGTKYRGMINAVRYHHRRCFVRKNATIEDIRHFIRLNLPVIINWYLGREKVGHFSVVVGISDKNIYINDPAHGKKKRMSIMRFKGVWHDTKKKNWNWMMVVLPRRIRVKLPRGKLFKP